MLFRKLQLFLQTRTWSQNFFSFSSLSRIFSQEVFDFASEVKLCFTSASVADLSASRLIAWMILFHNFHLHSTLQISSSAAFLFSALSLLA